MSQEREFHPEQERELGFSLLLPSGTELKSGPSNDSEPFYLKEDTSIHLLSDAPGWLKTSLEEKIYYLPTQAAVSAVSVQLEEALKETEGVKSDTSSSIKKRLEVQSSLAQIEQAAETLQEIIKSFPLGAGEQEILEKGISKIISRFDELA